MKHAIFTAFFFVFFVAAGCALTSKADPLILRYFTPEMVSAPTAPTEVGAAHGRERRNLELRLGRVNAASYIKDRIAFRDAGHELSFYGELRWSEKPESYLRRAVSRALFEDQGVRELVGRSGATLEVSLDAFEELKAPRHVARVRITWLLRDDQAVQRRKSFTVERPIEAVQAAALPDAIAAAMAAALGEAVQRIASGTVSGLEASGAQHARP